MGVLGKRGVDDDDGGLGTGVEMLGGPRGKGVGDNREGEDIKEVRRGERIVGRNRDEKEDGCGGTSELIDELILNEEGEEENDDDKDGGEPEAEEEEALEPNSSSSYSLLLLSLLCSPPLHLALSFSQSLLSNKASSKSLPDPDPDRERLRSRLLSLLHCLRGSPMMGVGNVLGTVSSWTKPKAELERGRVRSNGEDDLE